MPVGLADLDTKPVRRGRDALPGRIALNVGNVPYLVEACDGTADMTGVCDWFLALIGKGERPLVEPLAVDFNWLEAKNTPYADWYAALGAEA